MSSSSSQKIVISFHDAGEGAGRGASCLGGSSPCHASLVNYIEQFKQTEFCTHFGKRGLNWGSLVQPKVKSRRFGVVSSNALDKLRSEGKKRRSSWFFLANSQFLRIRDLGFLEVDRVCQLQTYYESWRSEYRKKYVHLSRENTHLFIKQYSRFDLDYKQFLKRKLRLLNLMVWDLKIELTVDPKKCMQYHTEFALLQKGWNRLRSWIRRRYGDFEYFKVLEITKAGRPHFHVLLSGVKWVDQNELSDLWDSYGCGKIVWVKRVDSRNNVKMCAYVLKYVNKTLNSENKVYSAVLFASNKRLFAMSKGCQNMLNVGKECKSRKGFQFESSVRERELIEFCDSNGVQIEAFMRIEADFEDYREFPLLFGMLEGG